MEKLTAKEVIQNKIEFETGILELHKKDLEKARKEKNDHDKQVSRACIVIKEEVIMVLKELLEEID